MFVAAGCAGYEKLLRLYDLARLDAEPQQIAGAPDKIRCLAWHKQDGLLLTSYIDQPGIGCGALPCPWLPRNVRPMQRQAGGVCLGMWGWTLHGMAG